MVTISLNTENANAELTESCSCVSNRLACRKSDFRRFVCPASSHSVHIRVCSRIYKKRDLVIGHVPPGDAHRYTFSSRISVHIYRSLSDFDSQHVCPRPLVLPPRTSYSLTSGRLQGFHGSTMGNASEICSAENLVSLLTRFP